MGILLMRLAHYSRVRSANSRSNTSGVRVVIYRISSLPCGMSRCVYSVLYISFYDCMYVLRLIPPPLTHTINMEGWE